MENEKKIGEWYTQYSAGYWQLVDLKPKFASEDYNGENIKWNKGDRLGDWAIVKKAFTPKMKKGVRVECVDSAHLNSVSEEIKEQIARFFELDPEYKKKFDETEANPPPAASNLWLTLTEKEAEEVRQKIKSLPCRFTQKQFFEITQIPKSCICKPPATHILNCLFYCWELTDEFDRLYFSASLSELKK